MYSPYSVMCISRCSSSAFMLICLARRWLMFLIFARASHETTVGCCYCSCCSDARIETYDGR
jgi:hypothetical protein